MSIGKLTKCQLAHRGGLSRLPPGGLAFAQDGRDVGSPTSFHSDAGGLTGVRSFSS